VGIKCAKHSWIARSVKVIYEVDTSPGAMNYVYTHPLLVEICLNCSKIRNAKKGGKRK